MMQKTKHLLALLLAAALVAGLLSGCGEQQPGDDTEEPGATPSGLVWTSEFKSVEGMGDYIGQTSYAGGKFYYSSSTYDEETMESRQQLWCLDTSTGTCTELTGYSAPAAPDGYDDAYPYVGYISATPDGDLLVSETISATKFNLPEGFSGTEEEKYQYVEYDNYSCLRLLDSTGAEKSVIDLSAADEAASSKLQGQEDMYGSLSLNSAVAGPDGNFLLMYSQSVVVLIDAAGQVQFCESLENWWDMPITLLDGTIAFRGNTMEGTVLRPFDFETKSFGEDIALPYGAYQLYPCESTYSFCYIDSSAVYGYDIATETSTKLAELINCDVDESSIRGMFVDGNGGIVCLLYSYDSSTTEIATLTQKDASELPETTTLRLACNYLDQNLRQQILKFNRANSGVRIEVADYSQYATEDDYSAGITKLNTEIISGNVPDLFVNDQLPISQYAAKGLLRDIYEFIDADEEISREDYFENVLKALEINGGLYSICSNFGIATLVGNADVVGPDMGWTLQEMQEVISAHPEVEYILSPGSTRSSILQAMLVLNMDNFVDWNTGECSFNGQEFIDLLNFSSLFPETYDYNSGNYESTPALVSSGRQLLVEMSCSDFEEYQMYEAMFGGHLAFKGFPTSEGVGNVISPSGSQLSISATCKDPDAAWRFVRSLITEDFYENNYYSYGYPILKSAYDAKEAEAMKATYQTDPETGEQVEVSHGGWGWDDFYVEIYSMSEEEAQTLRDVIASADRAYRYDQNIMNLVTEECADFFAGTKTAEQTASLIQDRVSIYVNEQR